MRRYFAALCFLAILAMAHTDARAGNAFLKNYSDWQRLSPSAKAGYVMGASDFSQNVAFSDDGLEGLAFREGYEACGKRLQFTDQMLVILVDKQYADAANWGHSPYVALLNGLSPICLTDYNAARAKRKLPDLK